MYSNAPSISLLVPFLTRRILPLCLIGGVLLYLTGGLGLTPSSPSSVSFPLSTLDLPMLPEDSDVDPYSDVFSCDPESHPQGSFLRKILQPPILLGGWEDSWLGRNHEQIMGMCRCLEERNCTKNQHRIIAFRSNHFASWYLNSKDGKNGGESIWATSIAIAAKDLGYTYYFDPEGYGIADLYTALGSRVAMIIANEDQVRQCFSDTSHCVKSPSNPSGIPLWKMFSLHFWVQPAHPLGGPWTLSPENYRAMFNGRGRNEVTNTYLGYSVEDSCMKQPFIPHTERPRGRVYAMAKRLSYFAAQPDRAWPVTFFSNARKKIQTPGGVSFVLGAHNDTDFAMEYGLSIPEMPEDGSVDNLGLMDTETFMEEVARSRVLLGVGRPAISPTPYQGLCLGLPFINPILKWDPKNPDYRGAWVTQHDGLRYLDPPYVYNVHKDNEAEFMSAIRRALENPIDRYIPTPNLQVAVAGRLRTILRTDWKRVAEGVLGERIRTKQGERFVL